MQNGYMKVNRIQNIFVILKKYILYRRQCVLFKTMMAKLFMTVITRDVKTFYENLYASRENNIIHCNIDNINTPTLPQEESDSLEGPITLQGALPSIKQMKNDKSPGSDGFTAEFLFVLFLIHRFGYIYGSLY